MNRFPAYLLTILLFLSLLTSCQSAVPNNTEGAAATTSVGKSTTTTAAATTTTAVTRSPAPADQIVARSAILYDAESGETLFERDADRRIAPASVTKLMTAITAFTFCEEEEVLSVDRETLALVMYDATRAGLQEGMQLTVRMLVEGLLLPSGCDAGYVLGVGIGRKIAGNPSLPAREAAALFSARMTDQARSFGALDTTFLNPDGYDANGHLTTAHDLALISRQALLDPRIAEIVSQRSIPRTFPSGQTKTWWNGNYLLSTDQSGMVTGLKTGFTDNAGHCLAFSFVYENRTYIGLVMGCPDTWQRWLDAEALIYWCTGQITNEELIVTTTGKTAAGTTMAASGQ